MSTVTIISGETRVNTTTGGNQTYPSVAGLARGGHVVTWMSENQDGSGSGVYVQRYDANGNRLGSETLVNTTTAGSQYDPSVAALASGGYVVVWTSENQDGSDWGIYTRSYDAGGNPQGGESQVNTYSSGNQIGASVAALSGGGYVVTWESYNQDGSGSGVYVQRYDAGSNRLGAETLVNTTTAGSQYDPSVAALSGGGYVVTWASAGDSSPIGGVYAQRYDASGNRIGTETGISTHISNGNQYSTSVAALSGGGYVVSWISYNQNGSGWDIYVQRCDAGGVPQGTETLVNTTTDDTQFYPSVAALSGGGYVVTWMSYSQDNLGPGIYAQRYDAIGAPQGAEILISPRDIGGGYPSADALPGGGYIVSWMSSMNNQGSLPSDIYFRTIGAPVGMTVMTSALEVVEGTQSDDLILVQPGGLNPGDQVHGFSGTDTLALTEAGTLDLTKAQLTEIEVARGSDGNDTFLFSTSSLSVMTLQGGAGFDTLATADVTLDLRNASISGFERITSSNAAGTELIIDDRALLPFIDGSNTAGKIVVRAPDLNLTAEERAGLFARNVDEITQANGWTVLPDGRAFQTGSETLVNTTTAGSQSGPSVAVLTGGGYLVTWTSYDQAGAIDVYAQRYDVSGNRLGGETLVNTTTIGYQSSSSVTALSSGGYVVTWMSDKHDGSSYDIYAQRYDASGTRLGGETLVNTTTIGYQSSASVAALSSGGYVVTWMSHNQDDFGYDVYAQRYDAGGTRSGGETLINTNTIGSHLNPSVATLSSGDYVVTWTSDNQDGSSTNIYAQRYDSSGTRLGGETQVSNNIADGNNASFVAALAGGGYVVTWISDYQDGWGWGIYSQRYDASGNRLGGENLVNTHTDNGQIDPSVAALPSGGYVVTWTSEEGQDGSGSGVYAQRYDANGNRLGGETLINTTTFGFQDSASVAALSGGGYVVTWRSSDSTNSDVYFSLFDSPVDYYSLTSAIDIATGSDRDTLVVTAAGNLGVGDDLTGGLGSDTLELSTSGSLDLTAPARLTGFERLLGTSGEDTFIVSPDRLTGFTNIDGRAGGDTVETAASSLDLSGVTLTSIERITTTNAAGTAFAVDSVATALLVRGTGTRDSITAKASIVTPDQYAQLVANGVEIVTDGSSTSYSIVSHALSAGVSNLVLTSTAAIDGTGNALANSLTGNAAANALTGGAGDDTLDGKGGSDLMRGGANNDTYWVDDARDLVIEAAGEGTDTVFATVSYALGTGQSIELLQLAASTGASNLNLTGNELANTLIGNDGANILDGGVGADTMQGGLGNDTYWVDNSLDLTIEKAGQGTDTVISTITYTLRAGEAVEILQLAASTGTSNLNINGNEFANTLIGNDGSNSLNGGLGADIMRGGLGNDYYVVDNILDQVIELADQGNDTIISNIHYTLSPGQSIERLQLDSRTGSANLNLTGNDLANKIVGNDGNNSLDGKGGADTLQGGRGNDYYTVDNAADQTLEAADQGNDTVLSTISYKLMAGQSIERLQFASSAGSANLNLTGNELANTITGNDGSNVLDGGAGADLLYGRGGADTFVFSTALGAANVDRVNDFSSVDDTIQLARSVFKVLPLGVLDEAAFKVMGTTAIDASDRILYNKSTGALFYDADGSGTASAAVQFAALDNKANITAADFLIV